MVPNMQLTTCTYGVMQNYGQRIIGTCISETTVNYYLGPRLQQMPVSCGPHSKRLPCIEWILQNRLGPPVLPYWQ